MTRTETTPTPATSPPATTEAEASSLLSTHAPEGGDSPGGVPDTREPEHEPPVLRQRNVGSKNVSPSPPPPPPTTTTTTAAGAAVAASAVASSTGGGEGDGNNYNGTTMMKTKRITNEKEEENEDDDDEEKEKEEEQGAEELEMGKTDSTVPVSGVADDGVIVPKQEDGGGGGDPTMKRKKKEGGEGEEGGEEKVGDKKEDGEDPLARLNIPKELPTVVDIKKILPPHVFVPSVWLSVYYMVKDFALVTALYLAAEWSWSAMPFTAQVLMAPVYWFLQGTLYTAIFVVGHDAGHESFSQSRLINDLCGNLCHAFLFCPYFMWKLSHRNHHKHTGNMDKEEVFYPVKESEAKRFYNTMMPGFGLGIGWFTYLVQGYRPRKVDHFNPFHPMFKNHAMDCIVSLLCLAGWLACLNRYWMWAGVWSLVFHWVMPAMVFGSYIVIITFLHHTDEEVPWYADRLWSYVRGQLSSVDRHYGWCHSVIHNIGTHQIHHLFPKIPHYHLEEATAHFRKAFPHLVRINDERILPAFCRMFQKYMRQSVIKDDAQIHVYK